MVGAASEGGRGVEQALYGSMPDGRPVHLFSLTNAVGTRVGISNYAGLITSVEVPDREGNVANVISGFDSLAEYLAGGSANAIIGRYANRIARGRVAIDGREYTLALNNGPHHIHGGPGGFQKKLWEARPFQTSRGVGVELSYISPDGEENYPGTLTTRVTYTLTDANELVLDYHATTDRPTVLNLTHHAYFNLSGDPERDILDHELMLNASTFTPADSTLIPTGEITSVEGTPFDFRRPTTIGARIDADHPQIRYGRGYDHNFVIDGDGSTPRLAARLRHPGTGRVIEVLTTEPGIQVYTGFRRRHAVALETQHFPDSPNQPNFPSTILRPGEEFRSTTIYRFAVQP
jgi:aldose 1-epimerase